MRNQAQVLLKCSCTLMPSQGFGEQGNQGIYFRGTGEQRSNFEENRGTKTILGNREHKKTNFRFFGNRGTSQFISGEQGNRYPPPPRRASTLLKLVYTQLCNLYQLRSNGFKYKYNYFSVSNDIAGM